MSRSDRKDAAARLRDEPFVHFGNIASSNQLQISATERNGIQQQYEAICFEMEAAGVMEEHPCVVIRGICDYADSTRTRSGRTTQRLPQQRTQRGFYRRSPQQGFERASQAPAAAPLLDY
jgi:nucleoside phosphorylase